MVETLCTSGAVLFKAGVNAKILTETQYTELINQAEGDIAADTGIDWVNKYSGISANFKQALEGAASNKAAIYNIEHDMSGYTSRQEALTMLNVLSWAYDKVIVRLKDDKIKKLFGVT